MLLSWHNRPIKVHAQLPTIYKPIRLFSSLLQLATLFSIVIFNHFNGEIELRLRIIIFKFKNNVLCSMENYGVIIIIYLIGTIFTFSATNSISSFFFIVCRINRTKRSYYRKHTPTRLDD